MVLTTSPQLHPRLRQHGGEVLQDALGLRDDVAFDDLHGRGIERDLPGGEEEAAGDRCLRVGSDGRRGAVGV